MSLIAALECRNIVRIAEWYLVAAKLIVHDPKFAT